MSQDRGCGTCWFAGMTPRTPHPDGPLKETCMVHDRRIRGGCTAWEEERSGMPCPAPADIRTARATFRTLQRTT